MFKIGKKEIKCKVEFEAEGDFGEMQPVAITIHYQRPTVEEGKKFSKLNAGFADAVKAMTEDNGSSVEAASEEINKLEQEMSDFVRERITGWNEVQDDAGEPLPFNPENLGLLFNDRDARRGVFNRYQQLITGRKEAAAENLKEQEQAG